MSVQAMAWVLESSKTTLGARLVMISIANHADPDGCNAWPSVKTICRETKMTEKAVHDALKRCVATGELKVERQKGGLPETQDRYRPNRYTLVMSRTSVVRQWEHTHRGQLGVVEATQLGIPGVVVTPGLGVVEGSEPGGELLPPEPSLEPSKELKPREPEFDELWKLYPRKDSRKQALNAFVARLRDGIRLDDLRTATENYALSVKRNGTERKFILLGSTFFGPNERWRDYSAGPVYDEGTRASPSTESYSYEESHQRREPTLTLDDLRKDDF